MKKFKKEIGHRLYVSAKKKKQLTQRNERQERALVTLTVHVHRHGVSVVPLHYLIITAIILTTIITMVIVKIH